MRAKRSKKYRKIMSTYNLHFSFRQPYQVLCDSNFLRQCHAFHMPVAKSLSNTLHGDARPYITQCSLARAVDEHRQKEKGKGRGDGKPVWLPPPTEVPLRYCKHKDVEGNEVSVVSEAECLVDLVAGQGRGNEVKKNRNHYVLATAEEDDLQEQRRGHKKSSLGRDHDRSGHQGRRRDVGGVDVRAEVRLVPGVPIVYVKRSVMVLEEPSVASERSIRGAEKEKLRAGLIGDTRGVKRKRDGEDESSDDASKQEENKSGQVQPTRNSLGQKTSKGKKVKGPNPMSVRKKKVRIPLETDAGNNVNQGQADGGDEEGDGQKKKRRKRKHHSKAAGEGQAIETEPAGAMSNQTEEFDA